MSSLQANAVHQALEALLLRCPAEITPYLSSIVQTGNQYIKYDPVSNRYRCHLNCPLISRRIMLVVMTRMKRWLIQMTRMKMLNLTSEDRSLLLLVDALRRKTFLDIQTTRIHRTRSAVQRRNYWRALWAPALNFLSPYTETSPLF